MTLPEGSYDCFWQVEGNLLTYLTLFKTLWVGTIISPLWERREWSLRDVSDLSKGTLLGSSSCHFETQQRPQLCWAAQWWVTGNMQSQTGFSTPGFRDFNVTAWIVIPQKKMQDVTFCKYTWNHFLLSCLEEPFANGCSLEHRMRTTACLKAT